MKAFCFFSLLVSTVLLSSCSQFIPVSKFAKGQELLRHKQRVVFSSIWYAIQSGRILHARQRNGRKVILHRTLIQWGLACSYHQVYLSGLYSCKARNV